MSVLLLLLFRVSLPNATVIADSHDPWTCKQKQLQTVQVHHDTTSRMDSLPTWPSVGQVYLVTSVETSSLLLLCEPTSHTSLPNT